jgi:hypothetical protein
MTPYNLSDVTMTWDDRACSVLRYTLGTKWGWDSFQMRLEVGALMLMGLGHSVDLLIDARGWHFDNLSGLPDNLRCGFPANLGRVVIVGDRSRANHISNALTSVAGFTGERFAYAHSMEEARRMVRPAAVM